MMVNDDDDKKRKIVELLEKYLREKQGEATSREDLELIADSYILLDDDVEELKQHIHENNWEAFEIELQQIHNSNAPSQPQSAISLEESKPASPSTLPPAPASQVPQGTAASAPSASAPSSVAETMTVPPASILTSHEQTKPVQNTAPKMSTSTLPTPEQGASETATAKRKQPDESAVEDEERQAKKQMTGDNGSRISHDSAGATTATRLPQDSQTFNDSPEAPPRKKRCNQYYERGYCEFHDNCKYEHDDKRIVYHFKDGKFILSKEHLTEDAGQPQPRHPGPNPELVKAKLEAAAKKSEEKQKLVSMIQNTRNEIEKVTEELKQHLAKAGQKDISVEEKKEAMKKAQEKMAEIEKLKLQLPKAPAEQAHTSTRGGYQGRGRGGRPSMTLDNRTK